MDHSVKRGFHLCFVLWGRWQLLLNYSYISAVFHLGWSDLEELLFLCPTIIVVGMSSSIITLGIYYDFENFEISCPFPVRVEKSITDRCILISGEFGKLSIIFTIYFLRHCCICKTSCLQFLHVLIMINAVKASHVALDWSIVCIVAIFGLISEQ